MMIRMMITSRVPIPMYTSLASFRQSMTLGEGNTRDR